MHTLRILRALLSREEKLKLLTLVPLALISSLFELAVVGSAAGFFLVLGDLAVLDAPGVLRDAYVFSGLSQSRFLVAFGSLVLSTVVIGNAYSMFVYRYSSLIAWMQVVHLGDRLLAAYLYRPYEFFLTQSTPELGQRLLIEVQAVVQGVIVNGLLVGARSLGALLMVGWLLTQEPLLTLVLVVVLGGVYGGMFMLLRRTLRRNGQQVSLANKARHKSAHESLSGAKEIKLHGMEAVALANFREPTTEFARAMSVRETLNAVSKYLLEAVAIGGLVLLVVLFLVSGRPVETILPILATFALVAFRLLPTLQLLFNTASQIQTQTWVLARLHDDASEVHRPPTPAAGQIPPSFEHGIQARALRYTYPAGDQPVLDGIDLDLPKGSWTALVGTTGSGKSTLVDVLLGLLRPQEGEVRVDDRPLQTPYDVAAWQQRIGYVPQAMFVTHDTIARNIGFGEAQPDRARVAEAARLAAVAEFIEGELPEGYDTEVGERGVRLSGGQRQRMGIARALYRQPQFLVLDEATSALDNPTEARVMRELRARFADTTVLMVAHRLSTTRHCDQIVMLEGGRVVDIGSYDDLYARSDRFRAMVNAAEPAGSPP